MAERKPKIVSIAGGAGRHPTLKGLKERAQITAAYNNIDSWGSSWRLRVENGALPYGDGTQACSALAATEEDEMFLMDRFDRGEGLNGHKVSNLMCEVAVRKMGVVKGMDYIVSKYCVSGSAVYPISPEVGVHLAAATRDGTIFIGEHNIDTIVKKSRITDVWLTREEQQEIKIDPEEISQFKLMTKASVEPLPEVIEAIEEADIVLLGPGSLYGSVVANLLVDGIPEAIKRSNAAKIFLCNFANDLTETRDYFAEDYGEAIVNSIDPQKQGFKLDYFLMNEDFVIDDETCESGFRVITVEEMDDSLRRGYVDEGKGFVRAHSREMLYQYAENIYSAPLVAVVKSGSMRILRHHPKLTADAIMNIHHHHFWQEKGPIAGANSQKNLLLESF